MLCRRVLLVCFGDFWLMTFFVGLQNPIFWEIIENVDHDDDDPLNSL